ncbi:MAG TPA: hypothetical protein VK745_09605 [Polyangiaceae bacterium]|jgi:hypothetical protein|nr:hypothetical protein [Polyangiaceae bacterium]
MIFNVSRPFIGTVLLLSAGCGFEHHAPIHSAELPPLSSQVLHSTRLWLDLSDNVPENTCVAPGDARVLCFESLRSELGAALGRSLWTSFPSIEFGSGEHRPGDYVLHVSLGLEALPPDASGPGWSAGARGSWRVERDGHTLAGEQVASRSRSEFAYGAPLGVGAGEVIDAVAVRIGLTMGALPESHVVLPVPLPPVATAPLPTPSPKGSAVGEHPSSAL